MPWLTTYDDTNKILDEVSTRIDSMQSPMQTIYPIGHDDPDAPGTKLTAVKVKVTYTTLSRDVTEAHYRYTSMDYATAVACGVANFGFFPAVMNGNIVVSPEHWKTSTVKRQNDAGAYCVEVVDLTCGVFSGVS